MINLTHLYDRKLCIGCASNPGFLCWPRLYESSRWCTDKPVFRFKSWPLSVTRIIIEIMCSARIEMQQGRGREFGFFQDKNAKSEGKNMFVNFEKYWLGGGSVGQTCFSHWPVTTAHLLTTFCSRSFLCWSILLKYLLYLLIFWIFTIASRKLTQNVKSKS